MPSRPFSTVAKRLARVVIRTGNYTKRPPLGVVRVPDKAGSCASSLDPRISRMSATPGAPVHGGRCFGSRQPRFCSPTPLGFGQGCHEYPQEPSAGNGSLEQRHPDLRLPRSHSTACGQRCPSLRRLGIETYAAKEENRPANHGTEYPHSSVRYSVPSSALNLPRYPSSTPRSIAPSMQSRIGCVRF